MRFFAFFIYFFNFFIKIDSKQQRSQTQRNIFLVEQGYCTKISNCRVPSGYEVDHVIPLYAGGPDLPSNMQLLTKEDHKEKTRNDWKIYGGIIFYYFFIHKCFSHVLTQINRI